MRYACKCIREKPTLYDSVRHRVCVVDDHRLGDALSKDGRGHHLARRRSRSRHHCLRHGQTVARRADLVEEVGDFGIRQNQVMIRRDDLRLGLHRVLLEHVDVGDGTHRHAG